LARGHRALHSFPTRRSSDLETDDFLFEFSYPAAAGRIPELATVLDVMLEQRRGELARQAAEALREARDNGFPYNKHSFSAEWKVDRKSTRLNSSHVKISYAV